MKDAVIWLLAPAAEHSRVRWLSLRLLALVYLFAFWSLGDQLLGLVGEDGILPAAAYLERAAAHYGEAATTELPTLGWLGADDGVLTAMWIAGVVLSLLALAGVAQMPAFAGLWTLYLSLVVLGQDFLSYQWDTLLLEAGALAILWAPARLRPGWPEDETPPPRLATWLVRWLALRLMFASGLVKLLSGDASWLDLTAMTHHYETQPIPNPLAWFAHQLPVGLHQASTVAMYVVEMLVPLLLFAPRKLRAWAVPPLVALQVGIATTGNYGFFNLLTAVLCLSYYDDRTLPWGRPDRIDQGSPSPLALWRNGLFVAPAALLVFALTLVPTLSYVPELEIPRPLLALYRPFASLHIANRYGLFAVMTKERPEIVIEGSLDGQEWRAYELRYKPGDPARRPGQIAPHMPRLDWQLWFAALYGDCRHRRARWFVPFAERLMQGAPEVVDLVGDDPFEGEPPRFIRATLWDYRFAPGSVREETGDWWVRRELGPFCPVLARRNPAADDGVD